MTTSDIPKLDLCTVSSAPMQLRKLETLSYKERCYTILDRLGSAREISGRYRSSFDEVFQTRHLRELVLRQRYIHNCSQRISTRSPPLPETRPYWRLHTYYKRCETEPSKAAKSEKRDIDHQELHSQAYVPRRRGAPLPSYLY